MVLSNKKLKQKLRSAKAALLSNGNSTENPSSIPQESLKSILDSVAQKPRLSKREKKRKKSETLEENGENLKRVDNDDGENPASIPQEPVKSILDSVAQNPKKEKKRKKLETLEENGEILKSVDDDDDDDGDVDGNEAKRKKKRKRDDEDGVKKVGEKNKKKKKKKKKKKGKKETENTEVKENLENGGGGSKIVQGLQETANFGDSLEACTKIYVGGIPYYSSEDDIRSYFESCGSITEIDCLTFPDSGKFRGIAIIDFKTEAAAKRALALDGSDMGGLFLKIQPYKSAKAGKSPSFSPAVVEGYNRIYAGNLSWEITEDDLKNLFASCNIASIRFGEDKETKEFKGYAHVDFSDSVSLNTALQLDQQIVCGRPVRITCAVPRKGPVNKTQIPEEKGPVNITQTPGEKGPVNKTQTPGEKGPAIKTEPPSEKNPADGDAVAAVSGKIKRRTCYECGERGHLSSSCPKKQAAEQSEPPPENNPADKDAVTAVEPPPENNSADKDAVTAGCGKIRRRTCYECGERGHLSSSCPKKQAAEQTNLTTS